MGMGYMGACADVVKSDFVKATCPEEYKAFFDAVEALNLVYDGNLYYDIDARDFAGGADDEAGENMIAEVERTLDALRDAFDKKTGLTIYFCYHNSGDNGDRYDDVDGIFWSVAGVYDRTPAGEKYRDEISRVNWVVYG